MDRLLADHFGGEVALRLFERPDQMEEFARKAAEIARRTYQGGLGCGFDTSPVWMSILQSEVAKGRTRCYWLECRKEPIAFQVGAVYEGIYFADFTGYLPQYADFSPGLVQAGAGPAGPVRRRGPRGRLRVRSRGVQAVLRQPELAGGDTEPLRAQLAGP